MRLAALAACWLPVIGLVHGAAIRAAAAAGEGREPRVPFAGRPERPAGRSGQPPRSDADRGKSFRSLLPRGLFRPKAGPERDITMKTLGGRQFWGDVAVFHDWRIQQNVFTKHYRLLDGEDYRHACGTLDECRAKLAEIRTRHSLAPMTGKAVIVVHGIFRSSKSFAKMRDRLREEGYAVFGFDYPSTRIGVPEAAEHLHQVIESLDGIEEIHFVVHSMGGLVVRAYLKEHRDERIRRMVMLGVPNLGAHMADRLQTNAFYKAVFGPAGQHLVSGAAGLIAGLPTPEFEFAVIAGARGSEQGYNPLVPGDDDGTVAVASTRLPGAADFLTVRTLHSFMMGHDEVIDATVRFVKTGRLREKGERQAIRNTVPAESRESMSSAAGNDSQRK